MRAAGRIVGATQAVVIVCVSSSGHTRPSPPGTGMPPEISFVIPFKDEEPTLVELCERIAQDAVARRAGASA